MSKRYIWYIYFLYIDLSLPRIADEASTRRHVPSSQPTRPRQPAMPHRLSRQRFDDLPCPTVSLDADPTT